MLLPNVFVALGKGRGPYTFSPSGLTVTTFINTQWKPYLAHTRFLGSLFYRRGGKIITGKLLLSIDKPETYERFNFS